MRASLLTLGVASTVLAASPEVACPPANVYMFPGNSEAAHSSSSNPATLNLHQAQLVLADFVGTGDLYSASKAKFPSNFKHKCGGGRMSDEDLNGKAPTAIVVVNGLPNDHSLFFQDAANEGIEPSFMIDEAPTTSFFRAFFDKLSIDVQDVYSGAIKSTFDKAISVISHFAEDVEAAAIKGLEETGLFKRDMRDMNDGERASHHRHKEDVNRIKCLSSELNRGQTAFVRVESLGMLRADNSPEYKTALQEIVAALRDIVEDGSDLRLLVIASPFDACTNKARTMIKRTESSTPLHRRASALKSSAKTGPFLTKEACEEDTDSCSGHGSCNKLANGLYACSCKSTYDAAKKKTTYWKGKSCQQKDHSVEVYLFFWTGLGIIIAIVAGLNLLFSAGGDPLPGILNVAKRSSN